MQKDMKVQSSHPLPSEDAELRDILIAISVVQSDWQRTLKIRIWKEKDNMSKMSELSVLLGEIINTGSSLLKALTAVRELVASLEDKDLKVIDVPEQKAIEAPKPAAKAKAKKEEPTYTLETVREVLSRKSNIDGGQHRAEVKALVKKYGNGGTLKDVPAEQYAALIAEAEVIGNA